MEDRIRYLEQEVERLSRSNIAVVELLNDICIVLMGTREREGLKKSLEEYLESPSTYN